MLKPFCGIGALAIVAVATLSAAQPPAREGRGERRGENRGDVVAMSVERMMGFDADQDGKLSKSEITDPRLAALFERADADQDEVVTKDELTALFKQEAAAIPAGGRGGPPGRFGGPDPLRGPPGGFGDRGSGAREGDRGRGSQNGFDPPEQVPGPPRPGEVLPRFLQDELRLTPRQRGQLEKLQTDVDARLARILTEEQLKQLAELRDRGPNRRGGPRRPGGPPPDERSR